MKTKRARPSPRRELYLVRHGECEPSDVLLGQFDAPLSGRGLEQAEALARQLEPGGIERLVCSSLRRAYQTAETVGKHLGVEVERDARLNEITYGTWDGLRWEEIERADPETAQRKLADWWSVTPLGGEALEAFYHRVEGAWHSLLDHPACVTAVVAHRAANAVLLALARGGDAKNDSTEEPRWKRISTFEQEHCGYEKVKLPLAGSLQQQTR